MRHLWIARSRTLALACALGVAGLISTACGGGGGADATIAGPLGQVQETANGLRFSFQVNGKQLSMTSDDVNEVLQTEANAVVLTEEERGLFGAEAERILQVLRTQGDVDLRSKEMRLATMLNYLSKAPEGYVFNDSTTDSGAGGDRASALGYGDKIRCLRPTTTVTAVFDDRSGKGYTKATIVGSGRGEYDCMGRCGPGCGAEYDAYTGSCLNHDACSRALNASGGGRDPNCGDEYDAARYDYSFSIQKCTLYNKKGEAKGFGHEDDGI